MMAPRPTRVFAGGFLEPLLAAFALLFSAVEPLPPGLFGWLATVLCFTGAATVGRIPRGGAAAVLAGLLVWSLGLRLVSFLGLVGLLIVVGSWAFRGRQHALSLGVVGVAVMVMAGTSHPGRDVAALLGLVAVVWGSGLSVFRATQRVKRVQAEHEGAVRRIQQELARDLHDRIAHAQAVVVMKADTLLECDNLSAVTRAEVMAIAQVTREASESLQRMLATLRRVDAPQRPDAPVGNSAPLGEQVTRLRRMGFTVLVEGSPEKIPAKVLPVIADVLVEAANNVIRHGDPRHPCVVSVACDPLGVGLQVTNAVVTPGPSSPGLGLVGIEERVRSVGGHSDWGHDQDRWWLRLRLPT
ncbi:MAG: histidine kinase [Arachnia propionica]|uniref:sensor histidine kinase n=1 Tax=Arachnia propionica TaxID=1750 RepID=UPI0026FEED50|nr:histidine kinase [Arachnia propionica]